MKRKILIIDDEIDFCHILKGYFEKRDCLFIMCHSLNDGIDQCHQHQPEILFLDNNLPDGNGWDNVGKIVEIVPHVKMYLVSAHREAGSFDTQSNNIIAWEKPISFKLLEEIAL